MFESDESRDLIQVNYNGQLPAVVQEYVDTTPERPRVLEHRPLVLSVESDRDFVERLLSVLKNSKLDVDSIELRKKA